MSQTSTFVLAIIGTITGTLGAASGVYTFVLSGYRIKAVIGFALETPTHFITMDDRAWDGFVTDYQVGPEKLYVKVSNKGRMPIDVEGLAIITRPNRFMKKGKMGLRKDGPPMDVSRMPHRLEYGSSCTWFFPLHEAVRHSQWAIFAPPKRRGIIQVELLMGDDRIVTSKNSLSLKKLDSFMEKWTAYQQANPPEFWRNVEA